MVPAVRDVNETMLTVVLGALGTYFLVLLVLGFARYSEFRRVRPTAVLIWPTPRPAHFRLLVVLGFTSVAVTVLNGLLERPLHHVLAQALMAAYFVLMVPLSATIPVGLYRDGVWADSGFLPYGQIGRISFRETPDIVLLLLPRGRSRPSRLAIPREEYGTVRKLLEEKKREGVMNTDERILGL